VVVEGVTLLPLAGLSVGVTVVDGGSVPVAGDCADGVTAAELVPAVLLDDGAGVGLVVEGLGVGVTASASHCQIVGLGLTLPLTVPEPPGDVDASVCGAMAAVTTNPAAVTSKMLPALRPMPAGRTRAKHMWALPVLLVPRLPGLSPPGQSLTHDDSSVSDGRCAILCRRYAAVFRKIHHRETRKLTLRT
jgi:hypothetical protein